MSAGAIEDGQGPEDYGEGVLQLEPDYPRIPVEICDTISVQIAQSAGGLVAGKNLALAANAPTKLLNGDETRGCVTVVAGGTFYLGFSANDCSSKIAKFPGNVPIQIRSNAPLWVLAGDADTYVSAIVEMWVR